MRGQYDILQRYVWCWSKSGAYNRDNVIDTISQDNLKNFTQNFIQINILIVIFTDT